MAKAKKSSKSTIKVRDMKAKKNPKGGASDIFVKIETPTISSTPLNTSINFSSLNFKK